MQFLKVALLGSVFLLIPHVPAMATKNFAASSHYADIEPTSGDEEPRSERRSEPAAKSEKIIIIRNGKPVGVAHKAAEAQPAAGVDVAVQVPTGCRNNGLANVGTAPLQFVHVPMPSGWGGFSSERYIDNVQGKVSYDGRVYDLKVATIFKRAFRPFSGVEFPMHVRFDYVDAAGDHVTVDVPVREGAANPALEKILTVQNALLDPEDLFPAGRQYTIAANCVVMGHKMNELVMTQAIEASPQQLQRFTP